MFVSFLGLIGGLIFLMMGAAGLVRGSLALALRMGVPPLFLGLTLVAFGTSAPEMAVAWRASLQGTADLVVGNIVGSNILNTLLVVGVCALLARTGVPLAMTPRSWKLHMPVLLAVVGLTTALIFFVNPLPRLVGAAGVLLLGTYTAWAYAQEKRHPHALPEEIGQVKKLPAWAGAILAVVGLLALILGSSLFLGGALALAHLWGLSNGLAGLVIVAVGTTLPELATSLMATKQRHTDLALGNVIGSSIFNILGIMGSSALIAPLPIAPEVTHIALWVMPAATLLFALHTRTGNYTVSKTEGGIFVAAFALYMVALFRL